MMPRKGLVFLFLLVVAGSASAGDILKQLAASNQAGKNTNYVGSFVLVQGNQSKTMRISHAVIDGIEYEKIQPLSGAPSEIIQIGGRRLTHQVNRNVARFNEGLLPAFTGDFAHLSKSIKDSYQVIVLPDVRVAGKWAQQVRIRPRDADRYGYDVWLDKETGMILKSSTLRPDGSAVKIFEFVNHRVIKKMDKQDFSPALKGEYASTEIKRERRQFSKKREEAPVSLNWMPSGFKLAGMSVDDLPEGKVHSHLYSDGLAAFTVFITESSEQEKKKSRSRISLSGTTVAATRKMQNDGGTFDVTVVGELPPRTVKKMLQVAKK